MAHLITPDHFTRVNNDTNGNPRYVIHFLAFVPANMSDLNDSYRFAVRWANKLGGRKFHNKQYGGGIVFQSYSLANLCKRINEELIEQGFVDSGFDQFDAIASTAGDYDVNTPNS